MRLWQTWQGSNRFCFDGHCLLPRKPCPCSATVPVMLTIAALFCLQELPRLSGVSRHATAAAFLLLAAAHLAFASAALSDPGMLPRLRFLPLLSLTPHGRPEMRRLVQLYCSQVRRRRCSETQDTGSSPFGRNSGGPGVSDDEDCSDPAAFARDMLERFDRLGTNLPHGAEEAEARAQATEFWAQLMGDRRLKHLRPCRTCNIRRPARCSHCAFCDNCVLDFDHHCFWIGNCVGARNHKSFLFFLVATTLSAATLCVLSFIDLLLDVASAVRAGSLLPSDSRVLSLASLAAAAVAMAAAWAYFRSKARPDAYPGSTSSRSSRASRRGTRQSRSAVARWRKLQHVSRQGLLLLLATWPFVGVLLGVLPLGPMFGMFITGPVVVVLGSMIKEQVSLVGAGLNVKQGKFRPRDATFTYATLLGFLSKASPDPLAPLTADLAEEALEELEEEEEEDDGSSALSDPDEDEEEGSFLNFCLWLRDKANEMCGCPRSDYDLMGGQKVDEAAARPLIRSVNSIQASGSISRGVEEDPNM